MNKLQKLKSELKKSSNKDKIELLNNISKVYWNISTNKSILYGTNALKLSKKLKDLKGSATSYKNIGIGYLFAGKVKKALNFSLRSLVISNKIKNEECIAAAFNNIGLIYQENSQLVKALFYCLKSLELEEKIGNKKNTANSLNNIASIYLELKKNNLSFQYNIKALKIRKKNKDTKGVAISYYNLGNLYIHLKNNKNALKCYLKSIKIYTKIKDDYGIANSMRTIALIYERINNFEKALYYRKKSLHYRVKSNEKINIIFDLKSIGSIYYEMQNYEQAEKYINKSIKAAKKINTKKALKENYNLLYEVYLSKLDYKNSLKYYKLYSQLNEVIYSENTRRQIVEMQFKYDTEKKEKDVALSRSKVEIFKLKNIELFNKNKLINTQKNELEILNIELKKSNAAKDKFFSIIAHDLKNPLSGLLLSCEFIYKYYDKLSKENIKKNVENIIISAKNIAKLLENLLVWSMSQANSIKYKPEKLDLNEIISDTINLLINNAKIKEIDIISKINKSLFIYADEQMVLTIIRNILSNAIKFTKHNGIVVVESEENDKFIEVSISDTGVGLCFEEKQNLFRLDSHLSTLGTDNESGTGLGLIICKEFIEKNKGKISVISEVGKGCTFKLFFPKYSFKESIL